MMKKLSEIEFECPFCGHKHKVLDWIDGYDIDLEVLMDTLRETGKVVASFPYVQCPCGGDYIVDIEQGYVTIYDDCSNMVFEEGFRKEEE